MNLGRLSVQTDDGDIIAEIAGEPQRGDRHHPQVGWEIDILASPDGMDDEEASDVVIEEIERLDREMRL